MRYRLPIRWFAAAVCVSALSACAGPAHVVDVAPHEALAASTYGFTPLTPNGADLEVTARALVAAQLAAHGYKPSADPDYLVDVAVSAHPGKVGLYTTAAQHEDVPLHDFFFGECDDQALRLSVIVIKRDTGKIVAGTRGGQLHCEIDATKSLPKLAEMAVSAALR
jgi:hypothetical protein